MNLYKFIKETILKHESGAQNEFDKFEDFVSTWF